MGKGDPEAPLVVVSSAGNKPFATSVNGGGKGDLVDMNLPEIGVVATTEDTLLFSAIETANRVLPRLTVRYSIRSSSWSLETLPQYQFTLALPTQPNDPQNVRLQFVAEVFLENHATQILIGFSLSTENPLLRVLTAELKNVQAHILPWGTGTPFLNHSGFRWPAYGHDSVGMNMG
nr:hypothetical protein Iba_chr05dCG9960 [Ipomoea batatas]